MLSIHDLGSLGVRGVNAPRAVHYYEDTTRADRESLRLETAPDGRSQGLTYALGPQAPVDLRDGTRLAPEDLENVLRGDWRGQAVQNAQDKQRFMGWDCTLSDIKGLSVVYAVSDASKRAVLDDLRREAALSTLREVAWPEMYARVGKAGHEHVPVSGLVTLYEQHLSRASDPQLHLHCIVPSFGWATDDRVHTIEFHEVYKSKLAIGAMYRLEMARLAKERLGLQVYRDTDGEVRVKGIPKALEEHFSKRSEQVEAELERRLGPDAWTEASATQKMAATVATRPKHDREYAEDWAEEARSAGLAEHWQGAAMAVAHDFATRHEVVPGNSTERQRVLDAAVEAARYCLTFGGTSAVTRKEIPGRAVFEPRQLLAETAARVIGADTSRSEIRSALDRARDRGQVIELQAGTTPLSATWSTPEMIRLEQNLRANWQTLLLAHGHDVGSQTVEAAVRDWEQRTGKTLSPEQRAAVDAVTSARGAALVDGPAGTGKTEILTVARMAYERAGYAVMGESYSGAAASEILRNAGIPSRTTALAEAIGRRLDEKTVVVMDEAARATSLQLARLVAEAHAAGAKVVLVGDPRQLQPIGPGNAFPHLARDLHDHAPEASVHIQEIRRQQGASAEVRQVSELAARGGAGEALRTANAHGLVTVYSTDDAMRRAAAQELADTLTKGKKALGITTTRHEAAALNAAVRRDLQGRRALPVEERMYAAREGRETLRVTLSEGDQVAFIKNDYTLGVRNGWAAHVVGIGRETGTVTVRLADHLRTDRAGQTIQQPVTVVRLDDTTQAVQGSEAARYVSVPARDVARILSLDYARTADRSQGVTVDHAAVVAHADSRRFDKQWAAVALTRQRETITVRLCAAGTDRPERQHAIYEAAHWPHPGMEGCDEQPAQNRLRTAREARDLARAAARETRDAWHQARGELKQARQDLHDAQASGTPHLAAVHLGEVRLRERQAHRHYVEAKTASREATRTAKEAWWEARTAARQMPEHIRGEQRQAALMGAAKALDRDRPGLSTCDYPGAEQALEKAWRERGSGRERVPGSRPSPYGGRHEQTQEHALVP
jgi:conjugative relaxase-like TrwC/TraI family protein